MYVIGSLSKLEYLDDVKITDCQRTMAKAHTRLSAWNGSSISFGEQFLSGTSMLTILKYDAKAGQRYGKLVPKRNGSKFDRLWKLAMSNNNESEVFLQSLVVFSLCLFFYVKNF